MKTEYISDAQVFHGEIPFVMGTKMEVLLVGVTESKGIHIWNQLHELAFSLDRMLNRFDPESEVSKMNRSQAPDETEVSEEIQSSSEHQMNDVFR